MQEKLIFEYAVIRVMPRVEREEFVNVGVILYCSAQKFLQAKMKVDEKRLQALYPELDITEVNEYLNSFIKICEAQHGSGPIGQLPIASRFRWLTATRSTVVQSSKVHPGFCTDPSQKLEALFTQLVD